jgi:hypothetical protein
MTISGEAKDETGITIGEDYVVYFTPDIVYLETEIKVSGESVANGGTVNIELDPVEAEFNISIKFNQIFLNVNQIDCIDQTKLSKIFPADAPVPVLTFAKWTQGQMFNQVWLKLNENEHKHTHYYKCVIPGGQNGITNGKGAYLKEDIVFYINVTFK